jgi:predicted SnoaL-like aldol condensation-catalyzing enzyme
MALNNQRSSAAIAGGALALIALGIVAARAQQPAPPSLQSNPTPGCSVSKKELEANRKVAMDFWRLKGSERVALADPSYKQHNPVFKKRGGQKGETDYAEFKDFFTNPPTPPAQTGPQPPPQNPFEIVTAECDVVTMVRKVYVQDPTEPPGKFYESFKFDTFRIKNGKLVEHWDDAVITAPAPTAAPPR